MRRIQHTKRATIELFFSFLFVSRSRVAVTEGERDQAVAAVGQLSDKTDSLEEQLDKLGRLLEEARDRLSKKAQQLEHAEVSTCTCFIMTSRVMHHGVTYHTSYRAPGIDCDI